MAGAIHLGAKPECPLGGRVTEPGERTEQCIAGHSAGVVVAALILIPGIANLAVIAAAYGLDECTAGWRP
jgi:hypothetical protein